MYTHRPRSQYKITACLKYGLLTLLFFCCSVLAEQQVHTILLQHRMAADVIPYIEGLTADDTAIVRGFENKLIIKADQTTIRNITELLKTIDVAEKSLTISVLTTHRQFQQRSAAGTHVEIETGETTQVQAQVSQWSTRNNKNKDRLFKLRAVEGHPVSINMGQKQPYKNWFLVAHLSGRTAVANGVYYLSADNGFKAVAVILPDQRVRVEIYSYYATLNKTSGKLDSSKLVSTVTGSVGQWLEIGLITDDASVNQEGFTSYSSKANQKQYVYLKIEPQPN